MRRWQFAGGAALGVVLVAAAALLAAELALRARGHEQADDGFPRGLFVADPARGYALAPGADVTVQRVHRFRIQVNERGYRDRSWNDADPRPRMLLVGSSALFGFGVAAEERLGERLERHAPGIRTYNAAVYGYGPPQARATIDKECAALAPRLVLYVHEYKMTRRDFLRDPGRGVAEGQLVNLPGADGAAAATPVAVAATAAEAPPWKLHRLRTWLWHRGWHPTQLCEALIGRERLPASYVERRYVATKPAGEFPADGPLRAAREVSAMAQAAARCGARFAMVLLPGPFEHRYAEEPASIALRAAIGPAAEVIDLRRQMPERPLLMLQGLDYFDAPALDGFARALAAALPRLAPGAFPGG